MDTMAHAPVFFRPAAILSPDGLRDGWGVRVEGGRIAKVGPYEGLGAAAGSEVIEAPGCLLAPGFVNGHMHMYGSLSHGITPEAMAPVSEFSSFLTDFWWPYVENRIDRPLARLTARWACVEMIKSGVTSFTDVLEAPFSLPGVLEEEADEVEEAGLRAFLSFEACQRVSEENAQLGLSENAEFVRRHNAADSLVKGMMSVHTLFTGSPDYLMQAKKLADELGCDIHMHLSESVYEPDWAMQRYGKRPVQIYAEMGFLDERVFASQAVQVTKEEIDTLAAKKVRAVSMPLSNCEVGGGVAPLPDLLAAGMAVGLGSDGYINNFFEVMRGAFLIHKAYRQDTQTMPAREVYRMATELGAAAMGLPQTGRLEEGYLADMITIGMDTPTPMNERNVYDQIILFRNSENVRDMMVNGRFLMREGRLLTLDEKKIQNDLRRAASAFWKAPPS